MNKATFGALIVGAALLVSGCHTDMWQQPKTSTMDDSKFFANGQTARPLVNHSVARGHLRTDETFFTGRASGQLVNEIPMKVDRDLILRGKERFSIYCTPCHGQLGDGNGMISQRGFRVKRPVASYHTDRLRAMPIGYFYDVITNGYGTMYSYASRVEPQDRWAIVAYIRTLQFSQHMPTEMLTSVDVSEMNKPAQAGSQSMAGAKE